MDAAYLKAANPKPFTILGKRLKRFCLGHEILFQLLGNRFSVESEEKPDLEDLFAAVHICSRVHSQEAQRRPARLPFRIWIYKKLRPLEFATYVQRELVRFGEYIKAHTELPDFYSKEGGDPSEPMGAPTIQAVKVSLMSRLGASQEDALNASYSLAFWDHLTWLESQGVIQIIDENEMARLRALDEQYVEMEKLLSAVAERIKSENRRAA